MTRRARRDRGTVLHWIVVATCLAVAAIVLGSEASIAPFHGEQKRLRSSDEALVLADSAVALARAELERGGPLAALPPTALGRGKIAFEVEKADASEVVVLASGSVDAPLVGGKGTVLVRRIRARFKLPTKGAPLALVEAKEL